MYIRDYQVSKVYKAENNTSAGSIKKKKNYFKNRANMQIFVDKIINSKWFKKRYIIWNKIYIKQPHRNRKYCEADTDNATIWISDKWNIKQIILHELAHFANPEAAPYHGKEFCSIYLEFVKRWLGKREYKELKNNFKKYGVDYEK